MIYNQANIPAKFYPFIIGHSLCSIDPKIAGLLAAGIHKQKFVKQNISIIGDCVLKRPRQDLMTTPDTHLYRVRKAEKIRQYIVRNDLQDHLAVPLKYLFWSPQDQQYLVVAEKMKLSEDVAQPMNANLNLAFRSAGPSLGGQALALSQNKPIRALTEIQAKALAELSILGYTDQSYNNVFFTKSGQVAILDTEPQKRALKKHFFNSKINSFLIDKDCILSLQAISGIAKLKLYCNPDCIRAVEKIETKHALWNIAKLILKIAACCLAIYCIPLIVTFAPIKIALIAVCCVKLFMLSMQLITICKVWQFSKKNDVGSIVGLERQSSF